MIIRDYVSCNTCGHIHITRIQIGADPTQVHVFNCKGCNEPIKVSLKADYEKATATTILLENCSRVQSREGTPIYLCADFAADPEQINQDMTFPSFKFLNDIKDAMGLEQMLKMSGKAQHSNISDDLNIITNWNSLKQIWRLENSGKYEISRKLNIDFSQKNKIPEARFANNLWSFLNAIFTQPEELRAELKAIIKNNRNEFIKFLYFYKLELRPVHRKNQFHIMSEFYDGYDQHSQLFPYIRLNIPLSKIGKVTLTEFDQVKSFYASIYEFFSGAICIYTCLNNIKEGRPYNQLKNITLSNYLETDKSKRRESIKSNSIFATLTEEFDSTVRNASFHNWFFLRADNETIEYRSGGTGALKTISYTEYLYRCGRMYSQFCRLLILELELDQIATDLNVYTFTKPPS